MAGKSQRVQRVLDIPIFAREAHMACYGDNRPFDFALGLLDDIEHIQNDALDETREEFSRSRFLRLRQS